MTDTPLVSIIIPNWNGLKHLPYCMNALAAQTYPNIEFIVADNASTDGSQEVLAKFYPFARQVQLMTNTGFTGACIAGYEKARGDIIILLNNDTEAEPTWVEEIVASFQRHPEAGSVASKMLLFDRRDHLHTAGDLYRVDGTPINRGVWQLDGPEFDEERYVFSACGGSSAYRRGMLEEIGFLHRDFFFSMEDVDLGFRAQLAGYKCVYAPKARLYHHLAATGGGRTASYYDGRNSLWVIARNYPDDLLAKYRRVIARSQWRRAFEALRAWRGEAARARLRGMWAGFWSFNRVRRLAHPAIAALQRVSSAEIEAAMEPLADA